MSRTLNSATTILSFAEAADALGLSHASLALALARGEIVRVRGSDQSYPTFRLTEVERYRAQRSNGRSLSMERPIAEIAASFLLALIDMPTEHEAAAELAEALLVYGGPACDSAILLRLDDELESVRLLALAAVPGTPGVESLPHEPVELSSNGYRAYRVASGLGAAFDHRRSFETIDVDSLFGFLDTAGPGSAVTGIEAGLAVVVPLLSGSGRGTAALLLYGGDQPSVSAETMRAIEDLAGRAGVALEAVRQRQQLNHRLSRAEALQAAARQLSRSLDYQDLLAVVADLSVDLLDADGAAVLSDGGPSGITGELNVGATSGLDPDARDWPMTLPSEHLTPRGAGVVAPLQVTDVSSSHGVRLPTLQGGRSARSALRVPIVFHGTVFGSVEVYNARPRAFSDDEIELLAAFAEQAAMALYSLRGQESRQRALLGAVEALASSIEARDGYTGEHCKRAVSRATLVARSLGLSEREVETVGLAAALHDIGKIAIPDAILRKPGPLTDDELAVIRRHPSVGQQIVAWVPELREVAHLVGAHQERWDGSGYPNRLVGEAIPLGARIIAVVDAYAAMTEDRPYRKGGSRQHAVAELERGSGTQFDPVVVECFARIIGSTPPGDTVTLDPDRPGVALNTLADGERARVVTGYLPVRRWQSRRASELAALNDILRAISSTLDLRRIYDLVYRKVSDLIDVDAFAILQTSDATPRQYVGFDDHTGAAATRVVRATDRRPEGVVVSTDAFTFYEPRHFPIIGRPMFEGVVAEATSSGRPLVVPDYARYAEQRGDERPTDDPLIGSIIAAPIFLGEDLLGLISVQARRPNSYDERHVGLLEEIALHIGLALRNAGVYAEAQRRAEQFEAIGRLAVRLNQLDDPRDIARALASESKHVVHSERCVVYTLQDNRQVLAAIEGDYTEAEREAYRTKTLPKGAGMFWWAIERGETVIIPDLCSDTRFVAHARQPLAGESGLIVPLIHEGQPLAVAYMVRGGQPFTEDDAQAMKVLAAHAATAISDALSHLEAQRRVRELEALQRAVAIVGANLERKTAVKAIVEVLADVFGYGHISMYNREGNLLIMLAQVGYLTPFDVLPIDRGVIARCVRTGEPILVRDVAADADYLAASADIRSEIAVPVYLAGQVVGALNVESDLDRELGEWDLALIELFSQQVSVALANVSQYERAVERASIDPVSRLPNHGALMERLTTAVKEAHEQDTPLSILFIDLDNFKRFNDAFGHRVGDQVLFAVGRFLERHLPVGSYVARYGGEEFVAVLAETAIDEAFRLAEVIRSQLAIAPLDVTPRERFPVTVSIGVGWMHDAHSPIATVEDLLDAADLAMYEAKRRGRNRVVRWDPSLRGSQRRS